MTTAALADDVLIVFAVTDVDEAETHMAPGVTSNGVLPDTSTPEKATMEPTALAVPVPSVNV